jgi:hypothetical protein
MNLQKSPLLNNLSEKLGYVFDAIDAHGWQGFGKHLPSELASFQEPTILFDMVKTYAIEELQHRVILKELAAYSTHERLLELFLLHCEILQPFKRGLVKLPFLEATRFVRHMQPVLDTICAMGRTEGVGMMGIVKDQGLKGVYVYGLYHWLEDNSSDLTGTMAAFDKALRWGEKVVDKIPLPLSGI